MIGTYHSHELKDLFIKITLNFLRYTQFVKTRYEPNSWKSGQSLLTPLKTVAMLTVLLEIL